MLNWRSSILAVTCCVAIPPVAAEAPTGCFTRSYDAAHLAQHRGQTVSTVKMKLSPRTMGDGYDTSIELSFNFNGNPARHYAVGICRQDPEQIYCGLEQDSGTVSLKSKDNAVMLSPLSDVRASGESGDEADFVTIKQSNAEDRNFALQPAPATDCAEFEDTD